MASGDAGSDQSLSQLVEPVRVTGQRMTANWGMPAPAKRLEALASLTDGDRQFLSSLKGRTVRAGSMIAADEAKPPPASLIVSGWCARVSRDKDDQHQILSVLLPGDAFGLEAAPWAGERLSVLALTTCVLVDAAPLQQIIRLRSHAHSQLVEACQRLSWLEQNHVLNQIVRLAGRGGYQRVAHFIVELYVRMLDVNLVRNNAFPMPLSQQTVAAVLGLSKVHLNRVTRQLQREGLVEFPRGAVRVPEFARVAEIAGFENLAATRRG